MARRPERSEGVSAPRPSFSVVLCTRNGAVHIEAQLRSILPQLRPDDELVVSDDASTDDTLALVRLAAGSTDATLRIVTNQEPSGVVRNFESVIRLATRDVVVLSDQDDVWHAHKLDAMADAFAERPEAVAMFSDARLLYGSGPPQGSLWQANGVDRSTRRRLRDGHVFEQLLRRNVVTGATLAFRTSIREAVLPLPPVTMHDYWIALVASAVGGVVAIDEPWIDYRVHDDQAVGPDASGLRAQYRRRRHEPRVRSDELAMFHALRDRVGDRLDIRQRELLDAKVSFLERRAVQARSLARRVPAVVADLTRLRYHRFGRGWRSAARDVVLGC